MSKITKLGLGIIAFEGTEHLKNITYELRDYCDIITICLQKTSYHGDPIKQEDIDEVELLKSCGLIDSVIWFEPEKFYEDDKVSGPRLIETDKRNFILDYLEFAEHCSHGLIIDSDEFYDREDFKRSKDYINSSPEIHVTYCQYINYYRDYKHLLVWPYYCYVPFISEISFRFNFKNGSFDKPSDPTRRYLLEGNNKIYHLMPYTMVKMHHLSWIRKDITRKIDSWSSKQLFANVRGLKEAIIERYTNYIEGQNAILMFNVPYYQVIVNKLPKQYIHPHYRINETPTAYLKYESSNRNS